MRSVRIGRNSLLWAVGLGVSLLACGVGSEATREEPVLRLVDLARKPAASRIDTTDLPLASVLDDTRPVLDAPREAWIAQVPDLRVPPDRRVTLRPRLPPALGGARRLVSLPKLQHAGKLEQLPLALLPVERGRPPEIRVDLELDADLAGEPVTLSLVAVEADATSLRRHVTPALEIPERASLAFAIGVMEHAWGEGPVSFEVSACVSDDCDVLFSESLDPADPEQRAWQERSVPLDALAGERRSFRFEARAAERARFSLPLWANPTLYARVPRAPNDYNVVLVSLDTLRADHLPSYGYERATAPYVADELARRGTLFEQPIAAATTTTPSHMTIFTSLQPSAHGSTKGNERLPGSITTLAEWVRAHHIDTAAITENAWVSVPQGFARGFDRFAENKAGNVFDVEGRIVETIDRAIHWLEEGRDRRFFLFVHSYEVHSPYEPPERYAALFGNAEDPDLPEPVRARDAYDREIRHTDDQLRRLGAALERLGLDDRTILIVTSDHGEEFLEHGLWAHGWNLYEEALRVPLLFVGPTIPAGRRVSVPVGHVDLAPTVLELLGLPPMPHARGQSLVGLLRGDAVGAGWAERPLFSESWAPAALGPDAAIPVEPPALSVRVGSRKLIRYPEHDSHRYEYYDVAADPLEREDRYDPADPGIAGLRALLDGYESGQRQIGSGADSVPIPRLDPAQEERLRALGYLE